MSDITEEKETDDSAAGRWRRDWYWLFGVTMKCSRSEVSAESPRFAVGVLLDAGSDPRLGFVGRRLWKSSISPKTLLSWLENVDQRLQTMGIRDKPLVNTSSPMVPAFLCWAEMLLLLALFGLSSSPAEMVSSQNRQKVFHLFLEIMNRITSRQGLEGRL